MILGTQPLATAPLAGAVQPIAPPAGIIQLGGAIGLRQQVATVQAGGALPLRQTVALLQLGGSFVVERRAGTGTGSSEDETTTLSGSGTPLDDQDSEN